jgi:signal peptidase II
MSAKSPTSAALVWAATIPLALSWGIDRLTKSFASSLATASSLNLQDSPTFYGPLGIKYLQNHGVIQGIYANSPPLLREVSLSTAGAFLLFIYCLLQYLLPLRSVIFRCGLSFWMGGILGNVTDRMANGFVTDFLALGNSEHFTPVFNLADIFQAVGYALVIYSLIRERGSLWRVSELRRSYWIDLRFQLSYCLKLVSCGLGFSVVVGCFTFSYFRIALHQQTMGDPGETARIMTSYFLTYALVTLAFLIVIFILGMILSHRIAGPLYAFERYIKQVEQGLSPQFKLRVKDEFKQLEALAERLKSMIDE